MKCYMFVGIVLVTLMSSIYLASTYCNEALCASIVSKCMLLKSCKCDFTNTTKCECCKDCHKCLSSLYTDCCVCVGMCPPANPDDAMLEASTIKDIEDPIPVLFNALTEEYDDIGRWTTFSYPVHYDASVYKPGVSGHDMTAGEAVDEYHTTDNVHIQQVNCTVAFLVPCMSLRKCNEACKSMGAASLRWFHEHGCCECISSSCHDSYGLKKPKCLKCPAKEEEIEEMQQDESMIQDEQDKLKTKDSDDDITVEMDEGLE